MGAPFGELLPLLLSVTADDAADGAAPEDAVKPPEKEGSRLGKFVSHLTCVGFVLLVMMWAHACIGYWLVETCFAAIGATDFKGEITKGATAEKRNEYVQSLKG